MSNGCICCTLREDLLDEVARLARECRFDYLLIESTGISDPLPVAATFALSDDLGAQLGRVGPVGHDGHRRRRPAFYLRLRLRRRPARSRAGGSTSTTTRSIAELLVDQVELANVLVLNKTDKMSRREVARLTGILRKLNQTATLAQATYGRIPLDLVFDTGLFDFERVEQTAGWLQELQGGHTPETEEYGIGSFVYRRRRPFHPARLAAIFEGCFEGVLRAKGVVWLATRHDVAGALSIAGDSLTFGARRPLARHAGPGRARRRPGDPGVGRPGMGAGSRRPPSGARLHRNRDAAGGHRGRAGRLSADRRRDGLRRFRGGIRWTTRCQSGR